jgi:hypothetical protein
MVIHIIGAAAMKPIANNGNMDHPMTALHLSMLDEERKFLST